MTVNNDEKKTSEEAAESERQAANVNVERTRALEVQISEVAVTQNTHKL